MYVKCYSAHVHGLEGQIIEVEVDISSGLPHFDIVGLPGSALREAKERVRSAIKNSGFTFPNKRITVNLAPAHIRKEGSYFDLSIAFAILLADKQLELTEAVQQELNEMLIIGELSLDGHVRKSDGILPLVLTAKDRQFKKVFLPCENIQEAKVIKEIQSIPIPSLKLLKALFTQFSFQSNSNPDLSRLLLELQEKDISEQSICQRGDDQESNRASSVGNYSLNNHNNHVNQEWEAENIEHIQGQEHVKRAFEVAACGFHHLLLLGPPGSGKTLLAKSFIPLLPDLSTEEAIEVTKVYSVAGLLKQTEGLRSTRAIRAPHHSITTAAIIGGGAPIKPGEISLAHKGVLFLDEFLEFRRGVIEALREPLQEGRITINRSHHNYTFPAHFLLMIALNPCPCGYYGYETSQRPCTCTAAQIEKYQQKLSGPLFDRIDIHLDVPHIRYEELRPKTVQRDTQYTTKKMKERIVAGILFKQERRKSLKMNGTLTPKEIKDECRLSHAAEDLLKLAFEELQLSARAYHKLLKLGRTIADLNQTEHIDETAIAEAIQYRSMDRQRSHIPR